MSIKVGNHKGYEMFFDVSSYNCPALKLWGYATDLSLIRAINAELRKREKKQLGQSSRESNVPAHKATVLP